jgi:hypothetical protein
MDGQRAGQRHLRLQSDRQYLDQVSLMPQIGVAEHTVSARQAKEARHQPGDKSDLRPCQSRQLHKAVAAVSVFRHQGTRLQDNDGNPTISKEAGSIHASSFVTVYN